MDVRKEIARLEQELENSKLAIADLNRETMLVVDTKLQDIKSLVASRDHHVHNVLQSTGAAIGASLKVMKAAAYTEPVDVRLNDPRRYFLDVVYTSINGNGRTSNSYCFVQTGGTIKVYNISYSKMWGSVEFRSYSTTDRHRKYVQAKDILDHKGLQFLLKLREKA